MRMGKKKQPTYRIVAADARSPRDGRFIEIVGTYDPRRDPSVIEVDNERALHWLRHGAQATERVQKLLSVSGAWEEFTGAPLAQKTAPPKPKAEEAPAEEPAAEEPVAEDEPAADEVDAEAAS
jgi:small subunit ribosomal protein S16